MKRLLLLLLTLILTPLSATHARAIVFDPNACDDIESVAEELVELDLSGMRQQGNPSKCLDQSRFKVIKPEQSIYGEGPSVPSYTLPKGRSVKVDVPTLNQATDTYTVRYHYIAQDSRGRPKNITDQLSFSLHHRTAIKTNGCARLVDEPRTFAMREECVGSGVKHDE